MENILNETFWNDYSKIKGWCTKEKAIKMMEYINDDSICVELGVWGGKSLLPIAIKSKNSVYGIDAWSKDASLEGKNDIANDEWWSKIDYSKMYNYTHNLMRKYKLNVNLLRMKSITAVKFFEENSIDFLHQDSNHSEKITCLEVDLYHLKIKPGGIWVFDDTNWPTTKKAQDLLVSKGFVELYDSGEWKIYQKQV